jgi:hypothetical protein
MMRRLKFGHVWTIITLSALAASCVTGVPGRFRDNRPQAWDKQRGPTVPHDTFPADCELCHISENWHTLRSDFTFDHAAETGVPLRGAHQAAQCLRCHNDRGPVGVFAQRGCGGCHADPHQGELSTNCAQCHTERTWVAEGQIAKHARTRFPLIGAHVGVACFRCHPGAQANNFKRADTHCDSCHHSDLKRATSPDHAALGWVENCQRCHTPIEWGSGGFVHNAFPLTGGHQAVACNACHTNGQFTGVSHACSACHLDDFQSTTNPNHIMAGFSQRCEDCHTTQAWGGAGFVHNKFPLTGAHQAVACTVCHANGVYSGLPHDCNSCHAQDYLNTNNPNHTAAAFSTQCQDCHSTTTWGGAGFVHNKFPLTGAHQATACAACHTNGQYAGTPQACSACHLADYQAAANPNHAAVGFPMTCEQCHNTTSWQGAVFNHTFNITSGPHRVYDCTECHRVPGNVHVVSCTHCHAHTQAEAGGEHQGVPGYVWDSNACVGCHPTGRH